MPRSTTRRLVATFLQCAAFSAASISIAKAADFAWDPNGAAPGIGGSGVWDVSTPAWNTDLTGGAGGSVTAWTNASGDVAMFSGGPASVTLGSAVTARGLSFDSDFTLTGSSITLRGIGTGSLGRSEIRVGSFSTATINSLLTVTDLGYTKSGEGTLILGGTGNVITTVGTDFIQPGQWYRTVRINEGTLKANNTNVFGNLGYTGISSSGSSAILKIAPGATYDNNSRTTGIAGLVGDGNVNLGSGGTLTIAHYIPSLWMNPVYNYSGTISGSGSLVVSTDQYVTQYLSGTNTFTGDVRLSNGVLAINSDAALGNASNKVLIDGWFGYSEPDNRNSFGTLKTTASFTTSRQINFVQDLSSHSSQANRGFAQIDVGGLDPTITTTFAGVITSTTSNFNEFYKMGRGTMVMTAANTYRGSTAILNGELVLRGSQGSLNNGPGISNASVYVEDGAKLTLDNTSNNKGSRIQDSANLTLNGGEFVLKSHASGSQEDLNSIQLGLLTASTITLVPNATGGATIQGLDFIRRFDHDRNAATAPIWNGSVIFVRGKNLGINDPGTADSSNMLLYTAPEMTGAGGAAGTPQVKVVSNSYGDDQSSTGTGNGLMTYDSARGLRLLNRTTEFSPSYPSGSTTNNVRVSGLLKDRNSAAVTNTLLLDNGTLSGIGSYLSTAGGIWASGTSAIDVAKLDLGSNSTGLNPQGLVIGVDQGGTLTLNAQIFRSTNMKINPSVVKAGSGTLRMNSFYDSFATPIFIASGTVTIGAKGNLVGPLWRPCGLTGMGSNATLDLSENPTPRVYGLSGGGTLLLGNNNLEFLAAGGDAVFAGAVTGSASSSLLFTTHLNYDDGEVVLQGPLAYGGSTRVEQGTRLSLAEAAAIPAGNNSPITILNDHYRTTTRQARLSLDNRGINLPDRIPNNAPLALHSAQFQVYGNDKPGAVNSEVVGPVTITGLSQIDARLGSHDAASSTLDFGTLTLLNKASIHFGPQNMGGGVGGNQYNVRFANGMETISDPLGTVGGNNLPVVPYAAAGITSYPPLMGVEPDTLVTYDPVLGVRPLELRTGTDYAQQSSGQAFAPFANNRYAEGFSPAALNSTVRINSVVFDSRTSLANVNLTGTGTLQVNSGAMLFGGVTTIASSLTLDFGSRTGYLHQGAGSLLVQGKITGSAGLALNGSVALNPSNIRFEGQPKTFTGGLYLNGENTKLTISGEDQLGAAGEPVYFSGGQLVVQTQNITFNRPVVSSGAGASFFMYGNAATVSFSGPNSSISGDGGLQAEGLSYDTNPLYLSSQRIVFNPQSGQLGGPLELFGIKFTTGRSNILSPNHRVVLTYNGSSQYSSLDLSGTTQTIGDLFVGTGSGDPNPVPLASSGGTGTLVLNGNLYYAYGSTGAVTVPSSVSFNLNGKESIWEVERYLSHNSAPINLEVLGSISNGRLVKEDVGTLSLKGANTYAGGTEVRSGVLRVGGGSNRLNPAGRLDILRAGTFLIADSNQTFAGLGGSGVFTSSAGSIVATVNSSGSDLFDGVISGGIALTKGGSGTLRLDGLNTYSGVTTVTSGTLSLGRSAHAPVLSGLGAILNGGKLVMDYTGGTSPKTAIVDHASLGLVANAGTGFQAGTVRTSLPVDPTKAIGWLDDGTATFTARYTYKGDVDLSGSVDSVDFNALIAGYGATTGAIWANGDTNYDGKVNTIDFNYLAGNFGLAAFGAPTPGPTLGAVVPEPASLGAAVLLMSLITRRRRVG